MSDALGPPTSERAGRRRVVPALTFLAGLLVGGVVVGSLVAQAGDRGGDENESPPRAVRASTPAPAPTPTPSTAAVTVVVPTSCLEALEQAEGAAATLREGVDAARRLDPARLQQLVDRLQEQAPSLTGLTQQCRQAAVMASTPPSPPPP